ncbi:hypothetical protein (plasmid) [Vibrio vulnificus YJ016]|uniref:Uncharacterized protein n=1 Tax=Vibrio vulnificus (strain YJ016) TaxID=196600 RepID=Q7MBK7_VIBVY|nr:hypothetical protein [Vibrio vulnificus YJ016]
MSFKGSIPIEFLHLTFSLLLIEPRLDSRSLRAPLAPRHKNTLVLFRSRN